MENIYQTDNLSVFKISIILSGAFLQPLN